VSVPVVPEKYLADELFSDDKANEVAGDMKYKGRLVVVTGTVVSIGKDILDNAYIVIGGEGFLDGVQCTFTEAENSTVAGLSKGRTVTVKGKIMGKMANVQVENSQLQ
jgi:tRNA_anti-like